MGMLPYLQSPTRLAVMDCDIGPGASGIDMVMSIDMLVAVAEPYTLPSSFCGFVHDTL